MMTDEFAINALMELPTLIDSDRLYLNHEGRVVKDYTYFILGRVGRTIMNTLKTGYNRHDIVSFYERLIQHLIHVINKCHTFFQKPYIVGNFKVFGILPVEGQMYTKNIHDLYLHIGKLKQNITILLSMYSHDISIGDRLMNINTKYNLIEQKIYIMYTDIINDKSKSLNG
jgi:hypothetical protein